MTRTSMSERGGTVIASISGNIEFEEVGAIRDKLKDAIEIKKPAKLVINLEEANYVDSSGLGLLIAAQRSMEQTGGKFAVCCVPKPVMRLLEQTNLTKHFTITKTEEETL